MKKYFCVISHTHWDREWYMSFSAFRLKLVDLIDRLLEIIEECPDYVFHLDAQTVVLEDYLEIRPQNENILKTHIKNGNILVGPWYLQNDFYLTNGESTVQNLETGIALAEKFGKCSRVGYSADQFGNVSQIPQILNGFGINSFVFGRGLNEYGVNPDGSIYAKPTPAEFIWRAPDGSECLAVHMKRWYNNAQHIPDDLKSARLLLDICESNFKDFNVSPYILLMNGVDHLQPQDDVLDVIKMLKEDGIGIEQTTLDDYIGKVSNYVKDKKLDVIKGALNRGADYDMLRGCWSSRIYLKRSNVQCEDLLLNKIEPLYSHLNRTFKGLYPTDELKYIWKQLLKNHPHDSICGCSIDAVHANMENNFANIMDMGNELLNRGLGLLATHNTHSLAKPENYSVTVFNPTERTQSGIVETDIKFLIKDNIKSFELIDDEGNKIPYETVERCPELLDVFSPLNLPGVLDVERVKIRFYCSGVSAFSTKIFAVVPTASNKDNVTVENDVNVGAYSDNLIENAYYSIENQGGTLVIKNKKSGRVYINPVLIEDAGDRGDSYVYRCIPEKPVIVKPSSFDKVVIGMLKKSISFSFTYDCPVAYDFVKLEPSRETVTQNIVVTAMLEENSDVIKFDYVIDNKAKEHRIRILFDSGIKDGVLITDSPFDVAERKSHEICSFTDSDTCHNSTFAEYSKDGSAFAIYTEGQHELEPVNGYLAFTILRATGIITRHGGNFQKTVGDTWLAPGNQCLRKVYGTFGVCYGAPKRGAELFTAAKFFRNGFITVSGSFDKYKYFGGRFAVQSAELEKLYYAKDKHEGVTDKNEFGFTCDSPNIVVTRCKCVGGKTLLRLVNYSDKSVSATCTFDSTAYSCDMSGNEISVIGKNKANIKFRPKQIITLKY